MNTQFITRPSKAAGRSIKKHGGSLASGSLAALLVTSGYNLVSKWLDSKNVKSEAQAVEERTTAQIKSLEERVQKQISDTKADQQFRDQAQWNAIAGKQNK